MKYNNILVGYDGSLDAMQAVQTAIDLVAKDGTIHVAFVIDPAVVYRLASVVAAAPNSHRLGLNPYTIAHRHLDQAAMTLGARQLTHREHLLEGRPANEILDLAQQLEADLIVVGSRGLRHGTRRLRGSVSTRIANRSHTSFLVVHHRDTTASAA